MNNFRVMAVHSSSIHVNAGGVIIVSPSSLIIALTVTPVFQCYKLQQLTLPKLNVVGLDQSLLSISLYICVHYLSVCVCACVCGRAVSVM